MLHLVFVEAALEAVPPGIIGHPSVRRNAKRRKKPPGETLLNRSLHHPVMDRIPDGHKRGRPDITNICLLEALGSPLNREGRLSTWIHTFGGYSIKISPEARLPYDCNRFNSLVEQLFVHGKVPPGDEEPLMKLAKQGLENLKSDISPTLTVALTSHGVPSDLEDVASRLASEEVPAVFIGAFPHGSMAKETLALADEAFSIYPESLQAWVVTSRLIYGYEKASGKTD
ncbi:16S rRNA methyltransferase [Candidatus Bathyarchaeota archaeon]|jgi:rRNA small subunit pseudouridine methyltransferase Nep1|nr:16S rRNA methyltransferase [Candidatus Bathyarchaeota archaeon]MDP6047992.1 16S rRNA methyltransferase [Candidatus Bathyarchaeota archaeon]MDP7443655.1 16S rRNA methyltransferase [Candidatus Bathyarchaeota archaeon]|tara:strand:+ start:831 stop:1514 length:684 start_codon:yes stop_codon:yes gene_type:complete